MPFQPFFTISVKGRILTKNEKAFKKTINYKKENKICSSFMNCNYFFNILKFLDGLSIYKNKRVCLLRINYSIIQASWNFMHLIDVTAVKNAMTNKMIENELFHWSPNTLISYHKICIKQTIISFNFKECDEVEWRWSRIRIGFNYFKKSLNLKI